MKFYATFGTMYAHEQHPTLPDAHPDSVVMIDAPDYTTARAIITGLTLPLVPDESPVARYSGLYDFSTSPDELERFERLYPRGAFLTITVETSLVKRCWECGRALVGDATIYTHDDRTFCVTCVSKERAS